VEKQPKSKQALGFASFQHLLSKKVLENCVGLCKNTMCTLSASWHEASKSGNAAVFLHFCNLKEVDEDGNLPIAGSKKKVRT
jgi:hypothetical protein